MKHATLTPLLALLGSALLVGCAGIRLNQGEQAYNRMAYDKASAKYASVPKALMGRDARLHAAEAARLRARDMDAAAWFSSADSLGALNGPDAMHYGQVLMRLDRTSDAADLFGRILAENPEDRTAQDLYASCLSTKSFFKNTTRFTINELVLPGIRNVFSATPYKQGLLVVGEQDAPLATTNPWNGMSYLDLYYSEKKTIVTWLEAQPVPGKVNGTYHEGPVAISADGKTMYFTRSHYTDRKLAKDEDDVSHLMLFRATLNGEAEWDDVRAFAYNGLDFSTGHPALSADGRTLYFASDRPGGHGGTDLWMSSDNGTGWTEPVNLGPTVNTPGNELFPTINGNTLYFASTAHENMGGLDIFSTTLQHERWTEPENLGYPMNTVHDDFAFVMEEGGNSGYLSSDRSGNDRIHAFTLNERIFMLDAIVMDSSGFLPHVEAKLVNVETLEENTALTDKDGRVAFPLAVESTYDVTVQREGYLAARKRISTKGLAMSDTLEARLNLLGIELNKPIAIENIYFDYDKWDIRPDAAKELDKLVAIIKENPDLNFELGSHTDARGGDLYNLVLSDARANSTVDYLIRSGADPARIKAQGYGEERLVNTCGNGVKCTEEAHQANRRTEFTITYVNMAGN
ncbi:MAG: OmpA family protein [Flavobacteriales bacterium]|nr:MAG: OmpA family protein [Flavobacteriales bacterium]